MSDIFEIKDRDLLGRIGVIHTRSGRIETPIFFPVVHPRLEDQELSVKEIENVGFNTLITNAYLAKKIYGEEAVKRGLKNILSFKGVLMTDSGAYQILRYGSIDENNRSIVEYQERLDQDIAVILDIPTSSEASREEALASVQETLRRAREVLDIISGSEKIWVLPIQGGSYIDLVEYSAREASETPYYKMYGIGSPVTFLENYEFDKILSTVIAAKKILPIDKPIHLFGAGHPMIIPFAVALGVDSFDSASYLLYARENRYMTEEGTKRLDELEEFPCNCPVCSRYTPRDLREMSSKERTRLLALHNLYVIQREIKRVKTAIREGRLWELVKERSHTHPRLRSVLGIILREIDFITKYSYYSKGKRGLFLTEYIDSMRPQIIIARRRKRSVIKNFIERRICREITFVPGDPREKPYSSSRKVSNLLREILGRSSRDLCLFYYTPVMGIVPIELEEAYPYSHYEYYMTSSDEALLTKDLFLEMKEFILEITRSAREKRYTPPPIIFRIYFSRDLAWSKDLVDLLKKDSLDQELKNSIEFFFEET